ncbi:hypothetical protein SLE2022_399230 [Rubroshorea leprosula]
MAAGFSVGPFSVNGLTKQEAIVLFVLSIFGGLFIWFVCCRRRNRECQQLQQRQQLTDGIVRVETIIRIENSEGEASAGRGTARLPVMYESAYYPPHDEMVRDYGPVQEYIDQEIQEGVNSLLGC